MQESIRADYRDGTFVPVVPCNLPEETEVNVVLRTKSEISPPLEADPAKRAEIMKRLLERMSNSPLPAEAPKLTRDQLHERS